MDLYLILGDQLSHKLLAGANQSQDRILMLEVKAEGSYVPHHPQKIALILSAMRHFAQELQAQGWQVEYVKLDDAANTQSFTSEVRRAVERLAPARLICTMPGEYRVLQMMQDWMQALGVAVEIREDTRFICPLPQFEQWLGNRKQARMELFYREMRKKTGLLMNDDGTPAGGAWNYDSDNREPYREGRLLLPTPPAFTPDAITEEVLALVAQQFPHHFGSLTPFRWGVTKAQAEQAFASFLRERLSQFGRYQDAMVSGADFMFHSLISPYLNIGLLDPLELCRQAEAQYHAGHAPLNAVEGFIRQILGWREYVRGIYWAKMPDYANLDYFSNTRSLPAFYWDDRKTDLHCLSECIRSTRQNAYAHHIQRLMVTGNFALLAGIEIKQITDWYLSVYTDAFEWVELPNTLGMIMYADGGFLGSKPYAASGKYINRMSDYCQSCRYNPDELLGEQACPLNALYWNFLDQNEPKLRQNPRMGVILASLNKMPADKRAKIRAQALAFLDQVAPHSPP